MTAAVRLRYGCGARYLCTQRVQRTFRYGFVCFIAFYELDHPTSAMAYAWSCVGGTERWMVLHDKLVSSPLLALSSMESPN